MLVLRLKEWTYRHIFWLSGRGVNFYFFSTPPPLQKSKGNLSEGGGVKYPTIRIRCPRSAARGDLVVPATKTVCYGPRSFAVAGPATWISLSASLRDDQQSVAAFRRLLKTELFARAYDSSLARSWLLLTVWVGDNFNYYYYYYY